MLIVGYNPLAVYGTLLNGALGNRDGQSYVLTYTGTLILSALAFLIPGKAGIWNVGAQGQIFMAGAVATIIAVAVPLPIVIWPLVAVLAAMGAGAFWAFIPGILEAYRNASAIVTTIMLNFVGEAVSAALFLSIIVDAQPKARLYNTAAIPALASIPTLPFFTTSIMIIIAILVALGTEYFFRGTTLGYKIRATGLGPHPAEAKGVNPRRTKVIAMVLGGLVAGLAGAGDVLSAGHSCGSSACYQVGFASGWFGGEGFAGIAVALVAASNPVGAIFSAIFFSVLVAGSASVGASGLNVYVIWAMQGLIIVFMSMPHISTVILKAGRRKKWT